mgnify:CR=1 FL=1
MALKKYIIWDKTSHVYTPSGISFTPEEWIKKYSWINAPGAIPVMSAGIINGAYIGELNQMRSSLENAGIDFSTATTNEEVLQIIENFEDQIIYIINYVIDELTKNQLLLAFISKNLSWGVYHETLVKIYDKNEPDKDAFNELREMFLDGIKKNNIKIKKPDVTLFMIIELVSATAFNAITYKKPLSIEEYKPYLYSTIRLMLRNEN